MKKLGLMALLAVLALMVSVPMVQATWDWSGTPINSGYAVTTDWHGIDVPPGETVTAWAGTTNEFIDEVKFRWMKPDGSEEILAGTYEGSEVWSDVGTVYEWSCPITADQVGDWGVQAVFYDNVAPFGPDTGHGQGPIKTQPDPVKVKARSFFVVPEVQFGTLTILLAMLASVAIFARKKSKPFPRSFHQ